MMATLARLTDTSPSLTAERCINQRHQQAGKCTACADACPLQAITLTPVPNLDTTACLACGACCAACPTDALVGMRSLSELWHKARATINSGGDATLACMAAGSAETTAARIPCVCALPLEFWFALAVAGAARVTIHTGDCDKCPLKGALEPAAEAVAAAQALLAKVGGQLAVDLTQAPPPPAPVKAPTVGMSRRGLFRSLLNPEVTPAPNRADGVDALIADGITPRRALLFDALDALNVDEALTVTPYDGHWAAVSADQRCIGCKMCAQFCPPEALATTDNADGTVTLWFDQARCNACGLCLRACFKHALTYEAHVALKALAHSEYRPIWYGKPAVNALKSPQTFKVRPGTGR
jgi:formate hydrogenlyase subunit 6/NADH:ubiquinone oxidoreductase subunit I